jgi:hypothetical protein
MAGTDNGGHGQPRSEPAPVAGDALSALLGAAIISDDDERAAQALALAFAATNGDQPATSGESGATIRGQAARPAATELSLGAVFGDQPAAPGSPSSQGTPSGFSFDQFFSQRATSEHGIVPATPEGGAEAEKDVAQFSQWLEGLKQR